MPLKGLKLIQALSDAQRKKANLSLFAQYRGGGLGDFYVLGPRPAHRDGADDLALGVKRKATGDSDKGAGTGGQCDSERMVIVSFVASGTFLARRESRQSRALGLGLGDGDRVELGFFRARERDQMAAVVDDGDAHGAVQLLRSVDRGAEHFHGAFAGQFPRWNSIQVIPPLIPRS